MTPTELRAAREKTVRLHMESENALDFVTTLGTFGHPHYEIIPTGAVYDGAEQVKGYFRDSRAAFPDQRNELISLRHLDDGVVVEFWLRGTHEGELRGIPPTHKPFECRCLAIFEFEGEGLVCERVYFDTATILGQLGILPGSV